MEKRALLAFVLALMVMILWQKFFLPQPQDKPVSSAQSSPTGIQTPEIPTETTPATQAAESMPAILPDRSPEIVEASAEPTPEPVIKNIVIRSEKFEATLATVGARLVSWKLPDYKNTKDEIQEILDPDNSKYMPGDIVIGSDDHFKNLLFSSDAESDEIQLSEDQPKVKITFSAMAKNGIEIRKSFTFIYDKDLFTFDTTLTNSSNQMIDGIVSIPLPDKILIRDPDEKTKSYLKTGPILFLNGKREIPKITKYVTRWVFPEPASWTAVQHSYFLIALAPYVGFSKGYIEPASFDDNNKHPISATTGLLTGSGTIQSGEKITASYFVYIGPKKYEELKSLGIGIENVVDFGWIEWLGRSFYYVLIKTTKYLHNYGLSIIILTIAIKIILLPLSHISMKSMKKMQEIQPMVKEIQARLKKDPQKMQEEMSKLYKKHGVNPMSGCLPLLIQFPVFIALYQVLLNSIEMRGASFLWTKDLAQPDIPLVLIMGVTMILQQKMTPTAGDPRQAKMMMFMPVIFTAMFWNFPSGLVLYWLVNNVLTIIQQYFMNAQNKPSESDEQNKLKSRAVKKLASKSVDESKGE